VKGEINGMEMLVNEAGLAKYQQTPSIRRSIVVRSQTKRVPPTVYLVYFENKFADGVSYLSIVRLKGNFRFSLQQGVGVGW